MNRYSPNFFPIYETDSLLHLECVDNDCKRSSWYSKEDIEQAYPNVRHTYFLKS